MIRVKSKMDKKSRRFQRSPTGRRILFERSLRPSCGTLIIVPLVLLEHWFEQLCRHVGLHYLSDVDVQSSGDGLPRGVVFIDGLGDIVDVEAPLPKLVVTEGLNASMENLASYMFVITTIERCAALQTKRMAMKVDAGFRYHNEEDSSAINIEDLQSWGNSPLSVALKAFFGVRWLRLVVDEGHELGCSHSSMNKRTKQSDSMLSAAADFIGDIAAERRWVMSGTPTTGTNSVDALWQLQKLLTFLRHAVYGLQSSTSLWYENIIKPIVNRDPLAWDHLVSLLKSIMIRHTKVSTHHAILCMVSLAD
jgi:hypothetical protein